MTAWRFLNTGGHDAAWNMALDEALLHLHDAGGTPPTVRVYAWTSPTLSLGYAQQARRDVDLEACEQAGVAVVRRPTGGRAVLHDQEVTYSVIVPTTLFPGPDTLTAHYRYIGQALYATLQRLSIPVQLEPSQQPSASHRTGAAASCFASMARYELSVMGRKLLGSAQKRLQRALLQHGSLPLWLDRHLLYTCLRVPAEQRAALIQDAYRTTTTVNEMAINPVNASAVHRALREAFARTFGIDFVDTPLLPEEKRLAEALRAAKYTSPIWNFEGAAAWRHHPSRLAEA